MSRMKRRDFLTLLGLAAFWPSVAGGQNARNRPMVGTIRTGTPTQLKGLRFRQSFMDGMRDHGYIDGRNFDMVAETALTTADSPKAAEQLVQLNPDVIFAGNAAHAFALKKATS